MQSPKKPELGDIVIIVFSELERYKMNRGYKDGPAIIMRTFDGPENNPVYKEKSIVSVQPFYFNEWDGRGIIDQIAYSETNEDWTWHWPRNEIITTQKSNI